MAQKQVKEVKKTSQALPGYRGLCCLPTVLLVFELPEGDCEWGAVAHGVLLDKAILALSNNTKHTPAPHL